MKIAPQWIFNWTTSLQTVVWIINMILTSIAHNTMQTTDCGDNSGGGSGVVSSDVDVNRVVGIGVNITNITGSSTADTEWVT